MPTVIDRDSTSTELTGLVDADYLFILTTVSRVAVDHGKPEQRGLEKITVEEAGDLCREGHFTPGSILPKIGAAIELAHNEKGRDAVVSSLEEAPLVMVGESGTRVTL